LYCNILLFKGVPTVKSARPVFFPAAAIHTDTGVQTGEEVMQERLNMREEKGGL